MRKLLFALFMLCASFPAAAQTNVVEVATISALYSLNTSPNPLPTVVVVDGYAAAHDGGGGTFVRNNTTCSDDGGVVIKQDAMHGNWCWFRQFSGPVHLSWYGVKDAADQTSRIGGQHAYSPCG